MTPEELVAAACPTIGGLGWAFYFLPETAAKGEPYGLDVFELYFLGRGGVLGDCEARVVTSAFGYFKPQIVEAMWNSGREKLAPRDAGRLFLECAREYGRSRFAEIEGLAEFCEAAEAVVAAADPVGLALFAGVSAEPLPDDLPARAQQLVTVLREFRGSAHLLAILACGLSPLVAHYVRRPEMWGIFGWADEDVPTVTAEDHAAIDAAEELTDRLVLPAYSVLEEAGRSALLAGLEAMTMARVA
jgi:hypothetical protein